MSENSVQNSVGIAGKNGGTLLPGGVPGNAGGTGRPNDEFRRKAGEKLDHWLDRGCGLCLRTSRNGANKFIHTFLFCVYSFAIVCV